MDRKEPNRMGTKRLAGIAAMLAASLMTGCQVDMAGQTLPSPYYLSDDVQYYAPGPGFKLAREAAALEAQADQSISEAATGY